MEFRVERDGLFGEVEDFVTEEMRFGSDLGGWVESRVDIYFSTLLFICYVCFFYFLFRLYSFRE